MTRVLCISDNVQNNLVIANLDAMTIQSSTPVGRSPYPVDLVDTDAVLASTRGETSVDLVRISDGCHKLLEYHSLISHGVQPGMLRGYLLSLAVQTSASPLSWISAPELPFKL